MVNQKHTYFEKQLNLTFYSTDFSRFFCRAMNYKRNMKGAS